MALALAEPWGYRRGGYGRGGYGGYGGRGYGWGRKRRSAEEVRAIDGADFMLEQPLEDNIDLLEIPFHSISKRSAAPWGRWGGRGGYGRGGYGRGYGRGWGK